MLLVIKKHGRNQAESDSLHLIGMKKGDAAAKHHD